MDAWPSQSLQPGKGKEDVEEGVLCVARQGGRRDEMGGRWECMSMA